MLEKWTLCTVPSLAHDKAPVGSTSGGSGVLKTCECKSGHTSGDEGDASFNRHCLYS
jgi:hypothetical protein